LTTRLVEENQLIPHLTIMSTKRETFMNSVLNLHEDRGPICMQHTSPRNRTLSTTTVSVLLPILAVFTFLLTGCASAPARNAPYDQALRQYDAKQYRAALDTLMVLVKDNGTRPVPKNKNLDGWRDAFFLIGEIHENGLGVPRDPTKALNYYITAAGSLARYTDGDKQVTNFSFDHNDAAYQSCLLSTDFKHVKEFCRPFDSKGLANYPNAQQAYQRYIDFLGAEDPSLSLFRAVIIDDIDQARLAIRQGANMDTVHPPGDYHMKATPLEVALQNMSPSMVNLLLENGANPNAKGGFSSLLGGLSGKISSSKSKGTVYGGSFVEPLLNYGYKPTEIDLNNLHSYWQRRPKESNRRYYELSLAHAEPETKKLHLAHIKETDRHNEQQKRNRQTVRVERNRQLDRIKQAELQQKRTIGTRICKEQNKIIFSGYVERVAENKLQIRVAHAHYARHPKLQPGGFKPEIIWDYPENWSICE